MLSFTEELENLESKIKSQPYKAILYFYFIFGISEYISNFFSSKTYSKRNFLSLEYVIRLGKQQKRIYFSIDV